MRRHLLALTLVLTAAVAPAIQSDPTVYRTRTGEKYHRDGCSYLRRSKIAIKLSEAKKEGLSACSKCAPPR